MPELNRRRFLQIAGATAGFTALSNSIDRAAAIPAARVKEPSRTSSTSSS